jgi:hypothetical protein
MKHYFVTAPCIYERDARRFGRTVKIKEMSTVQAALPYGKKQI